MDPRRLLIFDTVVKNHSIGAAARELGWTQPAVSQHLSALEKETGMQLLLRSSGGVTPTEAGTRLAVHAAQIAKTMKAATTEMEDIVALKKGRVRFTTFPSAAAVLLPPTLAEMTERHPGIALSFNEMEPPEAIAGIAANTIDVAMIFRYPDTKLDDEGRLEWTPILEDQVRLVLPKDHPLAQKEHLSLSDFAEDEWIAGCERCSANLMCAADAAGFTPRVRYSTDDSTVVQRLIAHGTGIALMSDVSLESAPNHDVVVRTVDGVPPRTIGIVNRPGAMKIPAISEFAGILCHQAAHHGSAISPCSGPASPLA
ncbi:LysR family transcriptional regulator [Helcobacillus massiliensis]|uniref:LysR family transcriptional regulator n=1 Tax=Helcobacillus TaxID=1161125 RepID=UPI001EF56436|nr:MULTISPECIES: LysR family transcriptional regulator [Helcobacillus]MCG7427187.1 LysR family transcriptional regulator [Helcobacillus sp. ACRRO]MCT1556793.1 LysR family transcriptional regulator [Helcobacillus massiliensis]MCT2035617.1 LysR family transcriptional regulator [Helcobacillus massiliensis]MCT2330931.1 LysR family transcriptional regulator [Helcobacillus massiliensis]MDK7741906.1 LysR family transcriptional regulator [Helcobacillus massiliensis]